ncbi:MAG: DUF1465 family protein [Hyphomicrobiaceae bacterium]|nr:DUF1465 family protein [Hyphomicrobiaceae bacterium]
MGNENIAGEGVAADGSVTFAFGQRLSALQFDAVFKDGMALVERTASYLDGPGRQEAKRLASSVTVLYATESMRLTARLLDVASWLLIRRALREGEITETDAAAKRRRLKLQPLGRPSHTNGFDELPETLRELVAESFTMLERIAYLEQRDGTSPSDADTAAPRAIAASGAAPDNPVGAQVIRLRDALSARRR